MGRTPSATVMAVVKAVLSAPWAHIFEFSIMSIYICQFDASKPRISHAKTPYAHYPLLDLESSIQSFEVA